MENFHLNGAHTNGKAEKTKDASPHNDMRQTALQEMRDSVYVNVQRRRKNIDTASKKENNELMDATEKVQLHCVQQMIENGKNINTTDPYGQSTVMRAASQVGTLQVLIEAGCDINLVDSSGLTALGLAARDGHSECVEQLIEAEADVDEIYRGGITPVVLATQHGHAETLRKLIKLGANFHRMTDSRHSALDIAVMENRMNCAQVLIQAGASLTLGNAEIFHSLVRCMMEGDRDLLNILLGEGTVANSSDAEGNSLLMIAAGFGKTRCVQMLLQAGADVHRANRESETAVMAAVRGRHLQCVRILVDAGAETDTTGRTGWSPILLAIFHGSLDILKILSADRTIQKTCDICMALCLSVEMNRVRCLGYLLDAGVHEDVNDQQKEILITLAVKNCSRECLSALLGRYPSMVNRPDSQGWVPLMHAAQTNCVLCPQELVSSGADLNFTNNGSSPLLQAVHSQATICLRYLASAGADFNHRDLSGNTVLTLAAEQKNLEILRIFIQLKDSISAKSDRGQRVMTDTAATTYTKCSSFQRIDDSPNINAVNEKNQTALMICSAQGFLGGVQLLIAAGARIDVTGEDGMTALSYAATLDNPACLQELLHAGANLDLAGYVLLNAALYGATRCMPLLLQAGTDPSLRHATSGATALMLAVSAHQGKSYKKQIMCTVMLLERTLDLDVSDAMGRTALHYAVGGQAEVCLDLLIRNGANIERSDQDGYTPLMLAASNGVYSCLRLLIMGRANINAVNHVGETALILAVRGRQLQCIHSLVKAGADARIGTTSGETLLMSAVGMRSTKALKLLLEAGADPDQTDSEGRTASMIAACKTNSKGLKLLLRMEKNKNAVDERGWTSLMYAVRQWQGEGCVKELISVGVDLNKQDVDGMTALLHAVLGFCGTKCMTLLIRAGADINIKDNRGRTALMMAAHWDRDVTDQKTFSQKRVTRLVRAGAGVSSRDNEGITVLMLAAESSNVQAVNFLLDHLANANLRDYRSRTPLIHAVLGFVNFPDITYAEFSRTTDALFRMDIDINAQDDMGVTALMYCARRIRGLFHLIRGGSTSDNESAVNLDLEDSAGCSLIVHVLMARASNTSERFSDFAADHLEYIDRLLKRGANPIINPQHLAWLERNGTDIGALVSLGDHQYNFLQLIRLLVCNGVMPAFTDQLNLLTLAFSRSDLGLARYLLANCYFSEAKLRELRQMNNISTETEGGALLLHQAFSNPWPLVKLACLAVTSAIGSGPKREWRVRQTGLPVPIQRSLLFGNPVCLIAVHHWDDIPLIFDPEEYLRCPMPYPLLSQWPMGQLARPCGCTICRNRFFTFSQHLSRGNRNASDSQTPEKSTGSTL